MSWLPVVEPIIELIKQVIPDPKEAARLQNSLRQAAIESDARMAEAQSSVVTAEAQGESWMQRNWRPTLMYFLMAVVFWYLFPLPILSYILGVSSIELVGLDDIPDAVWTLLIVGMGGYIGGRTLEKVMGRK